MSLKHTLYVSAAALVCGCSACSHQPSRVEILRQEKAMQDSLEFVQTCQTLHYSDSLLQTLTAQVDEVMKVFTYERNESYEDHGHYVHRLLSTGNNTQRCFLQVYVSDDGQTTIQSYYYGTYHIHQTRLRLIAGELYVEAEGSNHGFDVEGAHEILSVIGKDAINILQFVDANRTERIRVVAEGDNQAVYYLTDREKEAMADTYRLSSLMNRIHELERAIRICNRKIEQRHKHAAQQ